MVLYLLYITVRWRQRDAALDAVVAGVVDLASVLWVGSPGLAATLARRFAVGEAAPPRWRSPAGILVVVGSAHPADRTRVDALAAKGMPIVVARPNLDEDETIATLRGHLNEDDACLILPRSA